MNTKSFYTIFIIGLMLLSIGFFVDNVKADSNFYEDADYNELKANCQDGDWDTFDYMDCWPHDSDYIVYDLPDDTVFDDVVWKIKDDRGTFYYDVTDFVNDYCDGEICFLISIICESYPTYYTAVADNDTWEDYIELEYYMSEDYPNIYEEGLWVNYSIMEITIEYEYESSVDKCPLIPFYVNNTYNNSMNISLLFKDSTTTIYYLLNTTGFNDLYNLPLYKLVKEEEQCYFKMNVSVNGIYFNETGWEEIKYRKHQNLSFIVDGSAIIDWNPKVYYFPFYSLEYSQIEINCTPTNDFIFDEWRVYKNDLNNYSQSYGTISFIFENLDAYDPSTDTYIIVCDMIPPNYEWSDSDFKYRQTITLDGSMFEDSFENYPVLVSLLDNTDLGNNAQLDGDDIFFTLNTSTQKLSHEIEYYNDGDLLAWIKLSNIFVGENITLYMYYGNETCESQENVVDVWGYNKYMAVLHFKEGVNSGYVEDSTRYFNNGTCGHGDGVGSTNPLQNVSGIVGYGVWFDGKCSSTTYGGYIDINDSYSISRNSDLTISCWLNWGGKVGSYAYYTGSTYNPGEWTVYILDNGTISFARTGTGVQSSFELIKSNNWQYVTAMAGHYGLTDGMWTMVNKTLSSKMTYQTGTDTSVPKRLGGRYTSPDDRSYKGYMDEFRIYYGLLSPEYTNTSYNMMNNPYNFSVISFGQENYTIINTGCSGIAWINGTNENATWNISIDKATDINTTSIVVNDTNFLSLMGSILFDNEQFIIVIIFMLWLFMLDQDRKQKDKSYYGILQFFVALPLMIIFSLDIFLSSMTLGGIAFNVAVSTVVFYISVIIFMSSWFKGKK